uniref:tRNA-dihydrouridine(16/17) synthase [NAD(P)(+)] n=1 Tax=Panagrellus redivivus TaxID=6233 RepID=A0A7E4VXQ7_PANRE
MSPLSHFANNANASHTLFASSKNRNFQLFLLIRSAMADSEPSISFLCVDRSVPEPDANFTCSEEQLKAKKDYWRDQMRNIKKVVAPMVDQSELAFREFLRAHGADLAFSPMIHAHLFVNDYTYRKTSLSTWKGEREKPFIVQFCGNDSHTFLIACRYVEGFCDGVDLNLGCPQLIAKRGNYGAYLQEKRELITSMVSAVYKKSTLPISVKIRCQDTVADTIEYAKQLEAAGASMITIHGRTREMKGINTGIADWSHIAAVKKELDIPVIANGNIQLPGDVERCIEATGCDAVMSAEGILFNPYLFEDTFKPNVQVAREYLSYAKRFAANMSAVRAHIFRICHHTLLRHDDLRNKMSIITSLPDFHAIVNELESRTATTPEDEANALPLLQSHADFPDLRSFVEATPHWFAKPYVRPIQDDSKQADSEYRQNKRAQIESLVEKTGLSKRQIRKKERRRVDLLRVKDAKKAYPQCVRCGMPAAVACQNASCKKCCRLRCIEEINGCKTHNFKAEHMKVKREAFLAAQSEVKEVVEATT